MHESYPQHLCMRTKTNVKRQSIYLTLYLTLTHNSFTVPLVRIQDIIIYLQGTPIKIEYESDQIECDHNILTPSQIPMIEI